MRSACRAAQSVESDAILADGFEGSAIRDELKRRRSSAIRHALNSTLSHYPKPATLSAIDCLI